MKYNFVNPYNFIPFDSSKEAAKVNSLENEKLLTGSIEYSLQTKTPLIVLNTSNDDIFGYKQESKHKSYEFFSYEDLSVVQGNSIGKIPAAPVIPGSEIRGMFRSNYEIITDSCLPFLDSNQILHKRVSGFFKTGLIKKTGNNTYKLIEAEDCLLRTKGDNNLDTSDQDYNKNNANNKSKYSRKSYIQNNYKEGQKVYVSLMPKRRGKTLVKSISCEAGNNLAEAYLIKGMPGPDMKGTAQNKHCAHVFIANRSDVGKTVDISRLDETLKMYEQNDSDAYKEYACEWKNFKKNSTQNDCFPVYYSEVEDNIYLSPASGTMETYKKKINDLVDKKCACKDRNDLCPACSLFGMLADSGVGVASRIRFSDLALNNKEENVKDNFESIITLQELSSPKLQNMEFYLKRPSEEAQFWTYEYWIDKAGRIHLYDENNKLEVNGRKFYWHSSKVASPAQDKTERNITTRPLKSEVEFKGKVFFENISEDELYKLVWLINCGDFEELAKKKHGYKLGHAKPLGYGSIAVAVDAVNIRTISKDNGKISVDYSDKTQEVVSKSETVFEESKVLEAFTNMTYFDYVSETAEGIEISYPKVNDEPEVFQWFVRNHGKHSQMRRKKDGSIVPESWSYSTKDKGVMPASRNEMIFGEYMKPMTPLLDSINGKDLSGDSEGKNNGHKFAKNIKTSTYSVGQVYEFEVIGYRDNRDGKPFYLQLQWVLDTKVKASVPFFLASSERVDNASNIPIGSTVKLKYAGMDGKYPRWDKV